MDNEQNISESVSPELETAAQPAVKKTTRRRAAKPATVVDIQTAADDDGAASAPKAPVRRSRSRKAVEPVTTLDPIPVTLEAPTDPAASDTVVGLAEPSPAEPAGAVTAEPLVNDVVAEPKKRPRRRATAQVASPAHIEDPAPVVAMATTPSAIGGPIPPSASADAVDAAGAAAADVTDVDAAGRSSAGSAAVASESAEEAPAEPRKRPRRRATAKVASPAAAPEPAIVSAQPTQTTDAAETEPAADEATVAGEAAVAVEAPAATVAIEAPATEATAATGPIAAPTAEVSHDQDQTVAEDESATATTQQAPAGGAQPLFAAPESPLSLLFHAPDLSAVVVPAAAVVLEDDETDDDDAEGEGGRRRRRNRGRRNRPATASGSDALEAGTEESADQAEAETEEPGEGISRRRRRRRRGEADLELTGGAENDPPNTVTRVRAPRQHVDAPVSNKVTGLRGSTRLEAKKQRRRESRETGRRRQVITEAEFLARRESVDRTMVVRQSDDRIQIGVLEDGILAEHFVSKTQQDSLIGNVYLGKVQNVLPSMEAAFVDIGRGRNAVLYAGEVNWNAAHLDGQPRRIENALKSGDAVLVQVSKDPVGHKGARLTSQISLPGRYLVYVPGGSMTGISRKLPDVERNRLKRILKDHLPENAGVIVRTAAEGASEEELTHDINRLRAQWEGIETRASSTKSLAPEMLYGEPDLTIKVVRDVFNEDFSKLIVSGEDAWDTIEAYVTYVAPDLVDRLEKWTSDEDIFASHRIDEQISKALERKVFLPSGGSLVIDRTEAMTVVDVNTGKFTGSGGNLEETVTKNNLEAAEEVVRQLRLSDIGGIIVIDFIDLVLVSNRDLVLRRLVECLGRDRTKHQVAEVTSLGLVQMTRKRMGTGLLEVFGEQCEHCAGRGVVTHEVPVEHRRAHAVAAEQHHPPARIEQPRDQGRQEQPARSARNEKKRSRNRQQGEIETVEPPVLHPELNDAERQAKANAARAALATIAAATHSHHEGDAGHHGAAQGANGSAGLAASPGQAGQAGPAVGESLTAQPSAAGSPSTHGSPATEAPTTTGAAATTEASPSGAPASIPPAPKATGGAAVLTIGGEAIELPRGAGHMASERAADPSQALAGLAHALDRLAEAPAESHSQPHTPAAGTAPAARVETPAGTPVGATPSQTHHEDHSGLDSEGSELRSRPRRGRRNRSASRSQGAANTNEVQHHTGADNPAAAGGAQFFSSVQGSTASAPDASGQLTSGQVPAAAPKADEPIILGVGVPASDL
ncbi:MAG: ribonuclease [Micrococcaceae bacterium]|nr:ribonuclease [Micrococcaceae bacterium]